VIKVETLTLKLSKLIISKLYCLLTHSKYPQIIKPCHSIKSRNMHARATRPHIQNNFQNTWTYASSSGGTIYSSLPIIASRISLLVLTYLIVVSVPASPNITVHYRNSICTITAVQTTLTYVIETTYSRNTAKCGGIAIPCY
jgi:hypothetical protein